MIRKKSINFKRFQEIIYFIENVIKLNLVSEVLQGKNCDI